MWQFKVTIQLKHLDVWNFDLVLMENADNPNENAAEEPFTIDKGKSVIVIWSIQISKYLYPEILKYFWVENEGRINVSET